MKKELKDGYTVVYRSGKKRRVNSGKFYDSNGYNNSFGSFTDQLNSKDQKADDIVSIRDTRGVVIWKRVTSDSGIEEWAYLRVDETMSIEYVELITDGGYDSCETGQILKLARFDASDKGFPYLVEATGGSELWFSLSEAKPSTKEAFEAQFSPRNEGSPNIQAEPKAIIPRKQHTKDRVNEICQAMIEYNGANKGIPSEWQNELNELLLNL